jgi:hypothetical protein
MREGRRVIALAQHAGGATFAEVVAALSGETRASFKPSPRKRDLDAEDDDVRRRRDTARWLWAQREPLGGSIAETYLRKARGYGGPLPAALGFLRPFKDYPPSLIAAFAMPEESEPGVLRAPLDIEAVQLIALKTDGSDKAAVEIKKRTIGSPKGVPIVVAPRTISSPSRFTKASRMLCQRTMRPVLAPGRRAARPFCPISPTPFRLTLRQLLSSRTATKPGGSALGNLPAASPQGGSKFFCTVARDGRARHQ